MTWDDALRARIDDALNEADVLGLRPTPDGVDVLLHVLALPADGPLDPDRRRILRLHRPSAIDLVLRTDSPGGTSGGPAIPLADLDAVEAFFAALSWGGSMYGWHFLDDPGLTADWPAPPSLHLDLHPEPAAHSFYWFNECGVDDGTDITSYCIEGTVMFDDLTVHRADGTPQHLDEFTGDADRYWTALHAGDDRLSVAAQGAAQHGTPTWRPWADGRNTTTITGV